MRSSNTSCLQNTTKSAGAMAQPMFTKRTRNLSFTNRNTTMYRTKPRKHPQFTNSTDCFVNATDDFVNGGKTCIYKTKPNTFFKNHCIYKTDTETAETTTKPTPVYKVKLAPWVCKRIRETVAGNHDIYKRQRAIYTAKSRAMWSLKDVFLDPRKM